MTKKVRLYLDVDGVINAWWAKEVWPTQNQGDAVADNGTWTIKWSPEMIAELEAMDFDLVWTTTWRQQAPASIAPLIGYGRTARWLDPTVNTRLMHSSIQWKRIAVAEDQANDPSPFIWIDDEILAYDSSWALDHGGYAFAPHDRFGISPKAIEKMKRYIAAKQIEAETPVE